MVALKVLFDEAMEKQKKKDAVKRGSSCRRAQNQTGFKWLTKTKNTRYRKGYSWSYQRTINRERVVVTAADLCRLFDKVKSRGYHWVMLDEDKAKRTVENEGLVWVDFVKYMMANGGYVDYTKEFKLVISND